MSEKINYCELNFKGLNKIYFPLKMLQEFIDKESLNVQELNLLWNNLDEIESIMLMVSD